MENPWLLTPENEVIPYWLSGVNPDDDLIDAAVEASMVTVPYQPQPSGAWEEAVTTLPAMSESVGAAVADMPPLLYVSLDCWVGQPAFSQDLSVQDPSLFDVSLAYPTPTPSPASPTSSAAASPAAADAGRRCPVCPATFARASELQRHARKHTKPFVCPVCRRGHAAKKDMHRHVWTNHPADAERLGIPVQTRTCNHCGAVERQDNLARHMKTRHGVGGRKGGEDVGGRGKGAVTRL
jgi:hypothetical protein